MIKIQYWLIALALIFFSCYTQTVLLNPDSFEEKTRVAVLPFSSSGFLSSHKVGEFAAAEVARQMFFQRKAIIVERSIVKAAVANMNMSIRTFSASQLQKLGKTLNSEIIVLGEVRKSAFGLRSFDDEDSTVSLTFRLISPGSGLVLGVFTTEAQNSGGEPIKEMAAELVKQMNELKRTKEES